MATNNYFNKYIHQKYLSDRFKTMIFVSPNADHDYLKNIDPIIGYMHFYRTGSNDLDAQYSGSLIGILIWLMTLVNGIL